MNNLQKIIDLDDTLCTTLNGDYLNSKPKQDVINKLIEYKKGFEIVIYTSRNMRTYKGYRLINANIITYYIGLVKKNKVLMTKS